VLSLATYGWLSPAKSSDDATWAEEVNFARGKLRRFVGENKLGDQYKGGVNNSSLFIIFGW
jgi:hypothetical protein